ncbi:TlpA family protein disulfide reductase [Sphingobacterium kyonggiense]
MKLFYSYMERLCVYIIHFTSLYLSFKPAIIGHKLVYVRQVLFALPFCFIMFSNAQAQSPKKEAVARQLLTEPLIVGQKVPDEFWKREHLFYMNGDTIRKNLEEYRGKVVILDFWASWCGACLENFKKLDELKKEFGDDLLILLVNPKRYRDDYKKVENVYRDQFPHQESSFPTIIFDEYLIEIFPHLGIPHYAWVNAKGRFTAFTDTGGLAKESIRYQIKNPY